MVELRVWPEIVDFRTLKAAAARDLPAGHALRQAILSLDDELPLLRAVDAAILVVRMAYAIR
jgi:hypothetical protein